MMMNHHHKSVRVIHGPCIRGYQGSFQDLSTSLPGPFFGSNNCGRVIDNGQKGVVEIRRPESTSYPNENVKKLIANGYIFRS